MIQDTMNTNIGNTSSQLGRTPNWNDEIVGFEDEIAKLRARLTEGTKARDVISIVGMPGQVLCVSVIFASGLGFGHPT
ncbi:hypothetical protein P3S67_023673 [Capsicum chacoense]